AAPYRDASRHDVPACGTHPRGYRRVAPVEADVGVKVSVSSMKDVADGEIVVPANSLDLVHDRGKDGTRHDGILDSEIWSDPPHGAKGLLPPLPQSRPIGRSRRAAYVASSAPAQNLLHHTRLGLDGIDLAVQFDQENRGGV